MADRHRGNGADHHGGAGPQGDAGPAGPQGPPGNNSANGGSVPICSAADTVVSYQGALACKSTLPRYVDNGDGTVTDNKTGLMWEKKSAAGTADVHDVNNHYSYGVSINDTQQDGTLYTSFIAQLNPPDLSVDGTLLPCFANHCDWRIPNIVELTSILLASCGTPPCIDPVFGPTQYGYWSSTTDVPASTFAWAVAFGTAYLPPGVFVDSKQLSYNARAVRGAAITNVPN